MKQREEYSCPVHHRKRMTSLIVMILCINTVESLSHPCPDKCICLSDAKILCNGAGLTEVPPDLPKTVEELSFSRNRLHSLRQEMFTPWEKLRVLTLTASSIRVLEPFIFRGLCDLKELSIQSNPMTELTKYSFSGIENVSQVDLRKNKIETIHPYAFTGSRNIGMLFLQDNPIIRIRSMAFSGLKTVQFLYLPSWIKIIEEDSFFDLRGVGLLKLQSLDLHSLRPYTFRGLQNVTQISIQESDLGELSSHGFTGMKNIGELRIINNKIDGLASLTISQSENVDGVVVMGNHFLAIKGTEDVLVLESNERVVVVENFFPCNCQLLQVLYSPVARSAPLFARHNYCVSPYVLHGESIDNVNVSTLEPCPTPDEAQTAGQKNSLQASSTQDLKNSQYLTYLIILLFFYLDNW